MFGYRPQRSACDKVVFLVGAASLSVKRTGGGPHVTIVDLFKLVHLGGGGSFD